MDSSINEALYLPVALKCRKHGKTQMGLWRQAINEGKAWGLKKFNAICNGYLNDKEIEEWLIEQGFGTELSEARQIFEEAQEAKKKGNSK